MTQATGSSFFTQAMAVATANTSSTALPELLAFVGNRLGQARAQTLVQKVGHRLIVEQQYSLKETYLYGSSRLGVKNQQITLSSRVASVQNGSLTPVGNAMLNTDSVFSGTATALGLPKAPSSRVFHRSWGLKQYELSNHLGNVQVTVSDKKIGVVGTNNVDFTSYQAEIKSATDYYAYGMEMPGKSYQSTAYRYGMNTQEKDNEIYGPGNVFSALYWEYDARIARRWNVDPVVKEYEGAYTPFSGNPIWFVDILGDNKGWYKDKEGNMDYDPNVHNQKDLDRKGIKGEYKFEEGQQGSGKDLIKYFADGTSLYKNERTAYSYIDKLAKKTHVEQGGFIAEEGVLVMPHYRNERNDATPTKYGFKPTKIGTLKYSDGNLKLLGYIHTHYEDIGDKGLSLQDIQYQQNHIPNLAMFAIESDNIVYGSLSYNNGKSTSWLPDIPKQLLVGKGFSLIDNIKLWINEAK